MTREEVLSKAKSIVCGDREEQYGSPEDNFEVIADLWSVYLDQFIPQKPYQISAVDVSIMMCLMKIARIISGNYKEDSWVDAIGYLACGAEIDGYLRGENK